MAQPSSAKSLLRAHGVLLIAALIAVVPGRAAGPHGSHVLQRAQGYRSLTLALDLAQLRDQVTLQRIGGIDRANARVSVSCDTPSPHGGMGSAGSFSFILDPGGRREIWRYLGRPCSLSVVVNGRGLLAVELSGR